MEAAEKVTPFKVLKEIGSWVAWIGGGLLLALFINNAIIVNAQVISGSMENTIMTGDRVFGLRTSYWFREPRRFDVIVFENPRVGTVYEETGTFRQTVIFVTNVFRREQNRIILPEPYVKRIIGLPGETIEIRAGYIYIDNERLEEDIYAREPMFSGRDTFGPVTIADGYYFVLGDNRNFSSDSRGWGVLSGDDIIGKIHFSIFPNFNRMR